MKQTVKVMNITTAEFDSELMKSMPVPSPIRPKGYGITVKEYRKFHNCSARIARATLERMVEEKKLKCELMRDGRRTVGFVFSKPGK